MENNILLFFFSVIIKLCNVFRLQENILCLQEQFKLKEDKLLAESKKRDIEQRLELSKSAKEVKLAQKTVLKIVSFGNIHYL